MADLTDEMKGFLNSNLAWVATISKEGQVDLGPKMSMFIIDNNHIGYHERTAGQTYRNLLDGRSGRRGRQPRTEEGIPFPRQRRAAFR